MKRRLLRLLIVGSGILAAILLFQSLRFHIQVLLLNSPQEYRENATILLTDLFRHGTIPYTRGVMPVYADMYGVLYNAVMVPFTWVFGSSYTVFRAVNGLFIFFCFALVYMVFQKNRISAGIGLLLLVFWYAQTLQSNFDILARPEGLGELLFLASVIIPWFFQFTKRSIGVSIALSILAFYTKPYFALGGLLCGFYLFVFRSKRQGTAYLSGFAIAFGCTAIFVQRIMEFYFYNTVLFHLKNARYLFDYMVLQTRVFALNNIGLLAILLFPAFRFICMPRNGPRVAKRQVLHWSWDTPLVSLHADYFWCMFACAAAAVIGKFGGHDGNYLSYYSELIGPFLLIVTAAYIQKYRERIVVWVCILGNLGVLLYLSFAQTPIAVADIQTNWNEWTTLLDSYHAIYNAPPFAKYLYDKGGTVYDTGHTEYFTKAISKSGIFLFNDARDVYNRHLHDIDKKIQTRQFDLVMLFHDYVYYDFLYTGYLHYFIEQNYTLKEIKPLLMYHNQTLLFELWVKKEL